MYFAVVRQQGPNWDDALPMREQTGWDEHAAFIEALADEGFVVLVGPLVGAGKPHRALLVVDADTEETVHERLADDPWTTMRVLTTTEVDSWQIVIGDPARR